MVFENLRPVSNRWLEPIAKKYLINIDPNLISLIAFIFAIASGYFFYASKPLLGGIFALLNGTFDVLDGKIARARNKPNLLGMLLDHVLDRLSDYVIIFGMTLNSQVRPIYGIVLMLSTFLVSYMGAYGAVIKAGKISGGIVSRADRILMFFLIGVLSQFISVQIYGFSMLGAGIIFMIATSLICFFQRTIIIYKKVAK